MSVTCGRLVVFFGYSSFLHQYNDRLNIIEILLKVALNTINQASTIIVLCICKYIDRVSTIPYICSYILLIVHLYWPCIQDSLWRLFNNRICHHYIVMYSISISNIQFTIPYDIHLILKIKGLYKVNKKNCSNLLCTINIVLSWLYSNRKFYLKNHKKQ